MTIVVDVEAVLRQQQVIKQMNKLVNVTAKPPIWRGPLGKIRELVLVRVRTSQRSRAPYYKRKPEIFGARVSIAYRG